MKKHIVGGSVEQLPNTCQVENKPIDDLAAVITVMIILISSPRVNCQMFTFKGLEKMFQSHPKQHRGLLSSDSLEGFSSSCGLLFFDEFMIPQHKLDSVQRIMFIPPLPDFSSPCVFDMTFAKELPTKPPSTAVYWYWIGLLTSKVNGTF